MGGDEFVLLLIENDYQASNFAFKRIQQQLVNAVQNKDFAVGFSIGAVTFTDFPDSIPQMLKKVDSLMYQVKNNQKNALEHKLYQLQEQS